jgi:AbrB family looped-hinge helix DNA binding protein
MTEVRTKIGAGGRVVLPAEFRKAMGVGPGDEVIVVLDGGEVRILTPRQAVARAQAIVRSYVPAGRSLAAELVAERRRDAKRE